MYFLFTGVIVIRFVQWTHYEYIKLIFKLLSIS